MDTKQAKQIVMQAYQMYRDKDLKGLLALFHNDIEWIGSESDIIPFAGSYHGKEQVTQFFNKLEQAQDAIKFEPQTFLAEGDKVVVTGISTWHVKATGLTYDSPWVHVFMLRNGKVSRLQQYNDTAAAEAAYRPTQGARLSKGASLRHH